MTARVSDTRTPAWEPVSDAEGQFSSGVPDLDRLLGGGYRRGSFVLVDADASVLPTDHTLLFAPTMLNFLHRSRGILAVLPARDSPHAFRSRMLAWVSRRLFDSRVRVVDYIGEDEEAPYVVSLKKSVGRTQAMQRMVHAESAVRGARGRPFLEFNALEVLETVVGSEKAARMYLFGMKRTREVGNLGVALLRPGLGCADAVRSFVDYELLASRTDLGLVLTGRRPAFGPHLVVPSSGDGGPHSHLVPTPPH